MIINLSFEKEFVLDFLKNNKEDKLLDFAGVTQHERASNYAYAREIDVNHTIEKKSIETYVKTIGLLGDSELRDIDFEGFPVWWITSMAEKNNRLHWGKNVFFFFEFLNQKRELFDKDLKIILPANYGYLEQFILLNIKDKEPFEIEFFETKIIAQTRKLFLINLLKGAIWYSRFRFSILRKSSCPIATKNIFFISNYASVNINDNKFDIGWQKSEVDKQESVESINLPLPSINRLRELKDSSKEVIGFLKKSPSILKLVTSYFNIFLKSFRLKNKVKDFDVNGFKFNRDLILEEIKQAYLQLDSVLILLWLRNSHDVLQSLNIYYSDELYKSGRLLSYGLKSPSICSIGVQHGLITKNHSVYRIWEGNMEGPRSIPIPNKLLLWNKHFGDTITENNKRLVDVIIFNQDLHYENLISEVTKLKVRKTNIEKMNILWATTLWPHFVVELDIIKSIFDDPNKGVILRLHPLKRYIDKGRVINALEGLPYQISERTYAADLANSDLIITNSFSTVFYDAMKLNIPVFRIENYGTFCDIELKGELIRSINSRNEFIEALRYFR